MIRAAALAVLALMQGSPAPPPVAYADGKGLVAVEGARRINLVCAGHGTPTVVLTAGAGATAASWSRVQPEVARATRACAWDRAGYGLSDASGARQTAIEGARDLSRALKAAKVAGPLVLVGHSIGAYEVLLLADALPRRRLAGIVLVDPSLPDMFRATGADPARVMAGMAAPYRACLAGTAPCDRARAATALSALDSAGESAEAVVNPARDYGALPMVVLTAGAEPPFPNVWTGGHDALAALSRNGVNRYVPDSGHMIHREAPQAVVAAIGAVVRGVSLSSHTTTR